MASRARGNKRKGKPVNQIQSKNKSSEIALALTTIRVMTRRDGTATTTVTAHPANAKEAPCEISYIENGLIAKGGFGSVYLAKLVDQNATVAIKRQHQEKKIQNRELEILPGLIHCNIVQLLYYFHTTFESSQDIELHLVLEYIPLSMKQLFNELRTDGESLTVPWICVYAYQMFRALGYIHAKKICHRDIKPDNLLINRRFGMLKLCDFGSAARIVPNEPQMCYVSSRYYRAPELIFGATHYGTKIDMWSAGCVLGEMFLDRPMFIGSNNLEMIIAIIMVIGTPTRQQIFDMNPQYKMNKWRPIIHKPMQTILPVSTPLKAIALLRKLLQWSPKARPTPLQICADEFFDELRQPNKRLPNGENLPPLFNFSKQELLEEPNLNAKLLPNKYS